MEKTTPPRRGWPYRLLHVLAMLLIGPWAVYLPIAILTGTNEPEPGFLGILMAYASALGLSLVALALGIAIALFRPWIGWVVFVATGVFIVTGVVYADRKAEAPAKESASPAKTSRPIQVTVASEFLPPEKRNAQVTPEVISAMEDHLLSDFMQRHAARVGTAAAATPNVIVHSLRVEQDGHVLFMTELRPKQPTAGDTPVLRLLWNIHDGQLKRVFCAYEQDDPTWRPSACGKQVAQTFAWDGWYTPR